MYRLEHGFEHGSQAARDEEEASARDDLSALNEARIAFLAREAATLTGGSQAKRKKKGDKGRGAKGG